jgi:hypothetical protein
MWQCPKCEREFKNTNQDHYCREIETIDQYIHEQPEEVQSIPLHEPLPCELIADIARWRVSRVVGKNNQDMGMEYNARC